MIEIVRRKSLLIFSAVVLVAVAIAAAHGASGDHLLDVSGGTMSRGETAASDARVRPQIAAAGGPGVTSQRTTTTTRRATTTTRRTTTTTRRTTTTVPRSVTTTTRPAPPPVPTTGTIGYVGCSLSRGAVEGYQALGGTRFWGPIQDYSGGTLERWAENLTSRSRYWTAFDGVNQPSPARVVWWQLCTFADSTDTENYSNALTVLQEIQRRIPGVTVYVSAENAWEAPHVCDLTGADGPQRMQALAGRLAGEGRALLGPDLGAVPLNQIASDGCHPNEEGRITLGGRLKAFAF